MDVCSVKERASDEPFPFSCHPFLVKDYQLIQSQDSTTAGLPAQLEDQCSQRTLLSRYLSNFTSIISHLLQSNLDHGSPDAVEASWVLSLALKGLYSTLKVPALTD